MDDSVYRFADCYYTLSLPLLEGGERKMGKNKTPVVGIKPGQRTPVSGQYIRKGPRGGEVPGEITSIEGKPLPPTPKPGQTYNLVDPTTHTSESK